MDHRRTSRFPLETLVKLQRGQATLLATSTDIGLHGICVEMVSFEDPDSPLLISFRLRPADAPITTWSQPIWHTVLGNKVRLGLEFKDLDSKHHRDIADFLSESWQRAHPVV